MFNTRTGLSLGVWILGSALLTGCSNELSDSSLPRENGGITGQLVPEEDLPPLVEATARSEELQPLVSSLTEVQQRLDLFIERFGKVEDRVGDSLSEYDSEYVYKNFLGREQTLVLFAVNSAQKDLDSLASSSDTSFSSKHSGLPVQGLRARLGEVNAILSNTLDLRSTSIANRKRQVLLAQASGYLKATVDRYSE